MYNYGFFAVTPAGAICATGVAVGINFVIHPLKTILYSIVGAVQGAIGAYALAAFGYSCSLPYVAAVGAAIGAAIGVPFALAIGFSCLCPCCGCSGIIGSMFRLVAGVGTMFFASLALSLALALGPLPALAVAAGGVVTGVTAGVVNEVVGCVACVHGV